MSAVVYFMRRAGTDDVSRAGFGLFIWSSIRVKDCDNTGLFKMVVGVLPTCHTQYT